VTTITVSGPLFAPNVSGRMKDAIRAGLFDVSAEISADVQVQLYPGHGWRTGRLRGSIAARQFSDLGFEVRSGALTGEPVKYVYWVETGKRRGVQTRFPGYRMFARTWRKWEGNRRRIDRIMRAALVRAMS